MDANGRGGAGGLVSEQPSPSYKRALMALSWHACKPRGTRVPVHASACVGPRSCAPLVVVACAFPCKSAFACGDRNFCYAQLPRQRRRRSHPDGRTALFSDVRDITPVAGLDRRDELVQCHCIDACELRARELRFFRRQRAGARDSLMCQCQLLSAKGGGAETLP